MKYIFSYSFLVLCFFGVLLSPSKLESANLTAAKDLLSTSRLSIAARVDSTGTVTGGSNVKIQAASSAPFFTVTTASMQIGDVLTIDTGSYTVAGIVDSLNFTITTVMAAADTTNNDPIYLKVRPTHTVSFTTKTAVPNGFFQILIPADATTPNDGNPDDQGYDFGAGTVTVTAPADVGATYDFVTGVSTASGATGCTSPVNYHCFEVHYSGLGAPTTALSLTIGSGADTPIAPAAGDVTLGTAETYPIIIKNFGNQANPNSASPTDLTSIKVAHIEAVRVTATVDPTISMTICGDTDCADTLVNPGDTVDGEVLSSNTGGTSNATSVALGVLDLLNPRLQAQEVAVATNGTSGYVLTAIDDGNMRRGTDTIDDNVTPPTVPAVLNTVGTEAYGIHPSGADVTTGTWGTGSAAANKYSGTDSTTSVTLASHSSPTAAVKTFVTYKANISPITPQGDYAHSINYIATATF